MDKKTVMAVVLAAVVLFGYQFYIAKKYPEAYSARTREVGTGEQVAEEPLEEIGRPETVSETMVERAPLAAPEIPAEEIVLETDKYVVTLSNEGGCIKSIVLKEYPHPGTNEIFKLVDIKDTAAGIFNMEGLYEYNLPKVRFATDRRRDEVLFSSEFQSGVELTKKYVFRDASYHIELELYFHNPTQQVLYPSYSIVSGSNIDIPTKLDRRYTQIVSDIAGKARRDNGRKGEGLFVAGTTNYAGLQNKYFRLKAITCCQK